MREIKFRQFWRGRFHYWGFLEKDCFTGPINPSDPSQQFTGLHDKNRKEIYEGDVVKALTLENNKYIYKVGEIKYDSDCGRWMLGNQTVGSFSADRKVIGNIYENPELVK